MNDLITTTVPEDVGDFTTLVAGNATATAHVNDTINPTTVDLSASTVLEGAVANYVFTATLSSPSQGVTTVTITVTRSDARAVREIMLNLGHPIRPELLKRR